MRIVHDLAQARPTSRSHVTVGVFDGIHRGHQQLIIGMAKAAHAMGNIATVLTFDPHPVITLGYEPPPLLTTVEERADLLAVLGVDVLVVLPFTPAIAHTPATDFVVLLNHHLRLAELWGGPDLAFGHRREGNIPFLRQLGAEQGFVVHIVEPLMWEGALVNSSRVRAALRAGDILQATGCLGRPYRLTGILLPPSLPLQGRERGGLDRRVGVLTATLSLPPERLIPARGFYACITHTEQGSHPAVVSIGDPASVVGPSGGKTMGIKVHLPDLDIYDQIISLDFVTRLQDERPFPTLRQIADWLDEAG